MPNEKFVQSLFKSGNFAAGQVGKGTVGERESPKSY